MSAIFAGMSTITFGGAACAEPLTTLESCQRNGLSTEWWGKPNSWRCPLGGTSGQGWLLMSRAALDSIDINASHSLVMSLDKREVAGAAAGQSWTVTHQNLHIVSESECLTPGLADDPASCYLVEIADKRRLCRQTPMNWAYNQRRPYPYSDNYFSESLLVGTAYTWSQMVEDIWDYIGPDLMGDYPGLPFTPDGTPENFLFYGWYAIDALHTVLTRIGCALKLDTQADAFSIVQLCDDDEELPHLLALADRKNLLIWDDYHVTANYGRIPESLAVMFSVRGEATSSGASPYHEIVVDVEDAVDDVTEAEIAGYLEDTCAIVLDDMTADWSESGVDNQAALQTRADERAADFYRILAPSHLRHVYGVPLADVGMRPGAWITATRWGDRGRGLVTEIERQPTINYTTKGDCCEITPWSWHGGMMGWYGLGGGGSFGGGGGGGGSSHFVGDLPPQVTITTGGTTTITDESSLFQIFTGTSTQTIELPVVSTLPIGTTYQITNESSALLTITSSGGNTIAIVPPSGEVMVGTISTTGTGADSWSAQLTTGPQIVPTFTTTPTAGGTTTLTSTSPQQQNFTGTLTQTVQMPAVSTLLTLGTPYTISNSGTALLTITSSGGNTITTVPPGTETTLYSNATTGTDSSVWIVSTPSRVTQGLASTATAGGTTTLTTFDLHQQRFTGTLTQTVQMPAVADLDEGSSFFVINDSTGALTIQSSGGNTIGTVEAGTSAILTSVATSGTGASTWSMHTTLTSSGTAPSIDAPAWTKYTKTYSDFSDASTGKTVTLVTTGAKTVVHSVIIKHSQAFSGGALAGYDVSVGYTGSDTFFIPLHNSFAAVSDTAFSQTEVMSYFHAGTGITARATSTAANLNAATQGSVDIWVLTSTLP